MDEKRKLGSINFTYSSVEGYAPSYINGVYGGVTPYREIIANFFMERPGIPATETRYLHPDGSLGAEVGEQDPDSAAWTRHIHCGIILTLENARAIHAWLGEQIRTLESLSTSGRGGAPGPQ